MDYREKLHLETITAERDALRSTLDVLNDKLEIVIEALKRITQVTMSQVSKKEDLPEVMKTIAEEALETLAK